MTRILVVDDEPPLREVLREALAEEGYAVEAAPDGAAALRRAEQWRPDAIVLDLMMPVMDGWTFLKERAFHPGLSHIPVVVLSAAPQASVRRVLDLGAAAWLGKPFDLEEVLGRVSDLVKPPAPLHT